MIFNEDHIENSDTVKIILQEVTLSENPLAFHEYGNTRVIFVIKNEKDCSFIFQFVFFLFLIRLENFLKFFFNLLK